MQRLDLEVKRTRTFMDHCLHGAAFCQLDGAILLRLVLDAMRVGTLSPTGKQRMYHLGAETPFIGTKSKPSSNLMSSSQNC